MSAPGKHAPSGDLRIHYQDTGSGRPVVVLNGWSASGLIWPDEWVDDLAKDHRLLRICNRGTGWSDPVEQPFTVSDMVADAIAVLDAEGIERTHVFGLSMGGMIAQQLAIERPTSLDVIMLQLQAITTRSGSLAQIAAPTLIFHGDDDPLLPVANGRRLAELIPNNRYVELPGVGHLVPWEEPERAAKEMREFLAASEVRSTTP